MYGNIYQRLYLVIIINQNKNIKNRFPSIRHIVYIYKQFFLNNYNYYYSNLQNFIEIKTNTHKLSNIKLVGVQSWLIDILICIY